MVKPAAGSTPLAYSSPEAVQITGTVAKRHAKGGVADQRYAPFRPSIHADLTDAIEVKVIAGIESREDPGQLPAVSGECLAQDRLLRREPMRLRFASAGE